MRLREYAPEDLEQILKLIYDTVHTVNAADYSRAQLDAGAPAAPDVSAWEDSLAANYTVVAENEGVIAGFADLAPGGYFNRLYIHRDFQRMGIASELCLALENRARMQGIKELTVHASITARPFFEKRGYKLLREQRVIRRETELTNYVMHIFL